MPVYKSATPKEGGGIVLLEPGIYFAVVVAAKEGVSDNNNDKIELECDLYRYDKETNKAKHTGAKVWDNLTFTEKAGWKIDQFRASTGEEVIDGEEVELNAEDCVKRRGWVHIGQEEITKGARAGQMRNVVNAWVFDYDPRNEDQNPTLQANRTQSQGPRRATAPDASDTSRPPANTSAGVPTKKADLAPDDIPF